MSTIIFGLCDTFGYTSAMRIGMIGLGKMGGNMATRLTQGGHQVVGYDRGVIDPAKAKEMGI